MRCDEMIPCEIDDDVVNFFNDADHKFSLTFPTYPLQTLKENRFSDPD